MPHVYNASGKKAVYWQFEKVGVDKLVEIIRKEFPGVFPNHLDKLELIIATGIVALARKGVFSSVTEFISPVLDDFCD